MTLTSSSSRVFVKSSPVWGNFCRIHLLFCVRQFSTSTSIPAQQKQEVIVVRHGETDWNKALRVQGSTDIPLNDKGMAQATASAESLSNSWDYNLKPSLVYSSPLARAKDTAVAIAESLSDQRQRVQVSTTDTLREWNLGVIEGFTKEKAMQDFPQDWRIFSQWANPFTPLEDAEIPLTEGESMEQVRWRVVSAINDLSTKTGDRNTPILCVTHGGVMGQLLRHVVQTRSENDPTNLYSRPGNACISRFWLDCSSDPPHWTIKSWADTFHLEWDLAPIGADYDQKGK